MNNVSNLWHSFPEQPNPYDKIILFYDSVNYDIGYYKSINRGHRFLYFKDILLPDMIDALNEGEEALNEVFI